MTPIGRLLPFVPSVAKSWMIPIVTTFPLCAGLAKIGRNQLEDIAMEWEKHDGRIVRSDGLNWKLRVFTYKATYPYERMVTTVSLEPTPATKRSNHYKEIKRHLGDDWSTDVLASDVEFQAQLIQQLEAA